MPGASCAVYGCKNCHYKTKIAGKNIVYHKFPKQKDLISTVREEWLRRCFRADKINPETSRICSIHFTNTDYQRDLRNELLGLPVRKLLKKTAVPTLNLPREELTNDMETISRYQLLQRRNVNENSLLNSSSPPNSIQKSCSTQTLCNTSSLETVSISAYNDILRKYNILKKEHFYLKQTSSRKIKLLNDQLYYYKNKNKEMRSLKKKNIAEKKNIE